jgi:hypothetical protein
LSRTGVFEARYGYARWLIRQAGYERLPDKVPPRLGRMIREALQLNKFQYYRLIFQLRILERREANEQTEVPCHSSTRRSRRRSW